MKLRLKEEQPATVFSGMETKQAGEVRDRWSWSEPSIWTTRMLTALEIGVKGGKWFSLMDKVYRIDTLRLAFDRVKSNGGAAGVDNQTVKMYELRLEENLKRLGEKLQTGQYRPKSIRRVWIPKPGRVEKRPLGIPTVEDRVVQTALRLVLEPIFERDFAAQSYGFRPRRGCKDALRWVSELLRGGSTWVVDVDLKGYFDSIPHQELLRLVQAKVADGKVLALVRAYLDQDVFEGMNGWRPERGTPQGAVISPLLANIYLDPLDHLAATTGLQMVRYADDMVILCRSQAEAEGALKLVRTWVSEVDLELHPEKTKVVDATERGGFDFLGYHFERGYRWPRQKSLKRFKDVIRAKTKRTNGASLETIISRLNPTLRGWFEYFKHSHKWTFPMLDKWIRMRLRSILRKRRGGQGRGRGRDHQRWPNAFFANHGLFSMTAARELACQSAKR